MARKNFDYESSFTFCLIVKMTLISTWTISSDTGEDDADCTRSYFFAKIKIRS